MSDIQRYHENLDFYDPRSNIDKAKDGEWVRYAEHVAAVAAAEVSLSLRYLLTDRQYQEAEAAAYEQGLAQGQRDALAAAVAAVEALSPMHWKYDGTKDDYAECVTVDSVIAAIKGVQ